VMQLFQQFYDAGAEGYDILFGRVPRHFAGSLLRAAQLSPGERVLDVATGTGLVAEAIADAVGPTGHVTAVDVSRSMLARAGQRLDGRPNVLIEEGDAQAQRFDDDEFDAVVCSLALMLFTDPSRGASEIRRVLRVGGRAAVSVETAAQRSLTTRINAAIGRHVPSRAAAAAIYYSLGEAYLLGPCFSARDSQRWRRLHRRTASRSRRSTPISSQSSAALGASARNLWRCRAP
jgi:ubiquinone/menaquinone biosynthesis C-methylase UbiE